MLDTMMPTHAPEIRVATPIRQFAWLRRRIVIKGIAVAAFVMLTAEVLRIFVGSNFNIVLPGRCYRSAQPTRDSLVSAQRKHGIRTIINLRDENIGESWYDEEKDAAEELGIRLMNAGLSSSEQAPTVDFRNFIQAMRDAKEPILIHCANGNDRSGFASAIYLLMHTNTPLTEARAQLTMRYGHIPWGKAACLGRILDSYETWLKDHGPEHSTDRLYEWGMNVYRPEFERKVAAR